MGNSGPDKQLFLSRFEKKLTENNFLKQASLTTCVSSHLGALVKSTAAEAPSSMFCIQSSEGGARETEFLS